MFVDQFLAAILWSTLAIIISQIISVGFMAWLGLPPKKLIHEIEDVQNPAVGASFFITSLIVSLFVGIYASNGFSEVVSAGESIAWATGGFILALVYTSIIFAITHRVMGRINDESVYGYMKRELVAEQNASLAFFLGGLAISPFIAVLFQII